MGERPAEEVGHRLNDYHYGLILADFAINNRKEIQTNTSNYFSLICFVKAFVRNKIYLYYYGREVMLRVYLKDKIPLWLYKNELSISNIKDYEKFLIGFFDGDGGIYFKRYPYRIYKEIKFVSTKNKEIDL